MCPPSTGPFADLDLARRLERAEASSCAGIVETRAELEVACDARVLEVAGAHAMFDGIDSPMTQCFGLGVHESATEEVLATIESFYEERGAPTHHEICPLAGFELTASLVTRGYRPIEMSNVLFRPVTGSPGIDGAWDESLRVRLCEPDESDLWAKTAARGWSEHGDLFELLRSVARVNAHLEGAHSLIAEIDDTPGAAAALILNAGVAHLAGACTVPEQRRRGAQLALLDHRLRFANEQGCDLAMMGAGPGSASQRNAERHGFRVAYTRTKWQRQPT